MNSIDVAYCICMAVDCNKLRDMYNVNKNYRRAVIQIIKNVGKFNYLNFGYIPDSLMASLPDIFIPENVYLIKYVIMNQVIQDRLIFKLFNYPDFIKIYKYSLVKHQKLGCDVLEYIIHNYKLSYHDNYHLLDYQQCSIQQLRYLIEEYEINRATWQSISAHQNLSPEFIDDYYDSLDWAMLSKYQTLQESTIEKFTDYVNWEEIFRKQILSEPFIERYMHRVKNPNTIIIYQKVSHNFIQRHILLFDPFTIQQHTDF
jgi:hypothetical protein